MMEMSLRDLMIVIPTHRLLALLAHPTQPLVDTPPYHPNPYRVQEIVVVLGNGSGLKCPVFRSAEVSLSITPILIKTV